MGTHISRMVLGLGGFVGCNDRSAWKIRRKIWPETGNSMLGDGKCKGRSVHMTRSLLDKLINRVIDCQVTGQLDGKLWTKKSLTWALSMFLSKAKATRRTKSGQEVGLHIKTLGLDFPPTECRPCSPVIWNRHPS